MNGMEVEDEGDQPDLPATPSSYATPLSPSKAPDDDSSILNPFALVLRETPNAGRGVFSPVDIPRVGTILEQSPVLVLTREEWDNGKLNDGVLGGYAFCWSGGGMAVALGIASMFNHSPAPNVNFLRSYPTTKNPHLKPCITFRTARPIKAGEELFICYSADESKLWFSPSFVSTNGDVGAVAKREGNEQVFQIQKALDESDSPQDWIAGLTVSVFDEEKDDGNAEAGPSSYPAPAVEAPEDLKSVVDDTPRQDPAQDNREKPRRAIKKIMKQQRWKDKLSRKAEAKGDGDQVEAPSLALVNGSSETGSDRTSRSKRNGHPPEVSVHSHSAARGVEEDEAYKQALDVLGLVPMLGIDEEDLRRESVMSEKPGPREGEVRCWSLVKRIKGPVEDLQMEDHRQMQIWTLSVDDRRKLQIALDFIRKHRLDSEDLRHLKRVFRKPDSSMNSIVLCSVDEMEEEILQESLLEFSPQLSDARLELKTVPASPARTVEELAAKALIWPVNYSQRRPNPSDSPWNLSRKAWARKGIERIVKEAMEAKSRGELPVAVHVTCPPEAASVAEHGDIPPTPNFRASAVDTRRSTSHPLRHASLNCIAEIAHLRTVPPFSSILQKRNGADYLLTSLSLFITHEPCLMCTMALIHSRVKEIFYILPSPDGGGGFASTFGVHGYPGVNHRVDVFECRDLLSEEELVELMLPAGTNV